MTSSNAGQNGLAPLPTTPPPKHKSTTLGRPDHPDDNDNNNHIAPNAADQQQPSRTDASTTVHPSIEDASTKQQNTSIAVDTFMADADAGSAPPATMSQPASAVQVDADPFASSFPHTPMPNMDHAYMMMALAHMAGNQMSNQISPPPTVTPAQVTLPSTMGNGNDPLVASTHNLAAATQGLESFARIEFADSVFQMTTYAVIIGRDQKALNQARRDQKRDDAYRKKAEEYEREGLPPPSPVRHGPGKFSKSYVSEEGGMLGPESDSEGEGRPAKRRKTTSTGSSQKQEEDESQEKLISNRQYVSHTPGAAAVDLASLRPSPHHVPFVGIHSPGPDIASKTKAISREHLKIQFNKREGVFEAIPLHKNGFFIDEVHHKEGVAVLRSGDHLQIKDVDFRFVINGVPEGRTGAEEYAEEEEKLKKKATGGKEMSFEFEASHGNGLDDTSDSSLSSPAPSDVEMSDVEPEEEEEVEAESSSKAEAEAEAKAEAAAAAEKATAEAAAEAAEAAQTQTEADDEADAEADAEVDVDADADAEADAEGEMSLDYGEEADDIQPTTEVKAEDQEMVHLLMGGAPLGYLNKKRGPGRPPKNGIMSKREQRLLKKAQQEMAKKTIPQPPPGEPPIKRKVGRPRKHPLPDEGGDRPEKRKYKPRKPKGEDGLEGSDAERRAREKKEKKARPKSPPLELKIEDYTEEQLQKPNKNYGVLIDETLTAAGPDGLTLKQIYKRITQRYPWFYFHTETKGWESSVRHNLIGNEAFKKDDTTGLWSRVPGVELDAGKKRKATSPDRSMSAGYGHYNHPMYTQYAQQQQSHMPPGYQHLPHNYHAQAYAGQQAQTAARTPQYSPPGVAPNPGQPAPPVTSQPVAPVTLPGYGAAAAIARPQGVAGQPSTYSSPYASRPPPAHPAVKTEDGAAATSAPPITQPAPAAIPGAQPPPPQIPAAAPPQQARPTPTPPAQAEPRPVIQPRLLSAVNGLKNGLIENLKKAKNPKAEAIVMSALNRCLGLKSAATENQTMEDICMKGIQKLLDGFSTRSNTPGSGGTPTPSGPTNVFDSKVFNSLLGFKNVSSNALKSRIGEAKAEAVTLSAIDRVLGLADASIVPPPAEASASGSPAAGFDGIESHLMNSVKQLLLGLNQKLHGT
ncbi:forkhead domain-containing protein [Colletotrichum fioriniae PJ7]|uniref:Forkhead domain-containing protein n=1 Tax=Colletotrichum fioriniae PJ7 TaxID=1445577 RepID=A0A010RHS3_9PEZI|nr:forkhead domain-containing protein [Colletotrichum fioriniae PJ7]